ncbi:unnamed protein product [Peronospora farinosa]|uniref:RxLR effector PexRD54 WY domain-containing protein n=1 Tax=Peronospora farinosa TaxID=134698 RepID=A0AAV0STG9_9STRA|nr:unnamed protein product [Peronospora farinosa]CAI5707908.1 unnamed protein product [Peronospora farinosa]
MMANPNSNLPKRLQWYIVLTALTCVSASPSAMKSKTIFAGSASLKQPLGVVGQSDARVKRYLRRNSDATESMDDEHEDRVMDLAAIDQGVLASATKSVDAVNPVVSVIDQGFSTKVSESVKKTVAYVPNNMGEARKMLEKDIGNQIEFYRSQANLFMSDKFAKWSKSVDEVYKNKFDVVIRMLAAGRKEPTTQEIANDLELGLLRKWIKDGNEDNILNLLIFSKDKSKVLKRTCLQPWFNYLTNQKRNPYELFVAHAMKRYSDQEIVEMLAAEDNPRTKTIATKLVKQFWEKSDTGVSGSFDLLKLNKEQPDTVLRSPILRTWINYVELLGSDPYKVLLLTMRKQVGDKKLYSILTAGGNKLDSILAMAKNTNIRRTLLHMQEKRLQEYPQMKKWRKNGKSVGDVFDLLKLQDKGKEMLGTKDWDAWVAYVTFLEEQKQPTDQREIATVIYAVLKNRFSSKGLAKLVATAKTVESTKEIAGKWKRSEWRIAQRTPDDVFNLLKLKEKGNAVFESPEFENWALYVIELNRGRNREDDVELALQLTRHYGRHVIKMLKQSEMTASAKNDEDTKLIVGMLLDVIER